MTKHQCGRPKAILHKKFSLFCVHYAPLISAIDRVYYYESASTTVDNSITAQVSVLFSSLRRPPPMCVCAEIEQICAPYVFQVLQIYKELMRTCRTVFDNDLIALQSQSLYGRFSGLCGNIFYMIPE